MSQPRTIDDALGEQEASALVRVLQATVDVVSSGLDARSWEPTPESPAEVELQGLAAHIDTAGQPWGENPLRTVWAFAKMNCDAVLDFCAGVAETLGPPARVWSPSVLARAATEAASQMWWVMEDAPGVDGRARVVRLYLANRRSAGHLARAAGELGVTEPLGNYGPEANRLDAEASALGIPVATMTGRRRLEAEGQILPTYTERATAFLKAAAVPGAYGVHSGSAHVELFALLSGYVPMPTAGGSVVVWERYLDRQVARSAVFVCVAAAIVPSVRLAEYFGWSSFRERLDDLVDEVDQTFAQHQTAP